MLCTAALSTKQARKCEIYTTRRSHNAQGLAHFPWCVNLAIGNVGLHVFLHMLSQQAAAGAVLGKASGDLSTAKKAWKWQNRIIHLRSLSILVHPCPSLSILVHPHSSSCSIQLLKYIFY